MLGQDSGDPTIAATEQFGEIAVGEQSTLFIGLLAEADRFAQQPLGNENAIDAHLRVRRRRDIEEDGDQIDIRDALATSGRIVEADGHPERLPCTRWPSERMCLKINSIIISAHIWQMRGPPMGGNSLTIRWASVFLKVFWRSGPNFLWMKSGLLLMGGPSTSDFFFVAAGTDPEEFVQMISHVAIELAFFEDLEIGLDEGDSSPEEKGDLSGLELLACELSAAREGGQVVGDRFGRVVHDLADLRGGLALERKADDLSAMREDRSEVVECAAHGDQHIGVSLADQYKGPGDSSRGDEEDAICEVFGGEQGPLAESLLAKVEDSRLAKAGRAVLLKQQVVDLAAMDGQANGLLLAVADGLSGGLIGDDGDEGDLPWGGFGGLGGEEGE